MKYNLASRYGAAASIVGLALLAQHFFLHRLSEQFFYEGALVHSPILMLVIVQVGAGLVFLSLFWVIPRLAATRAVVLGMLGVGLLLRLMFFGSTPILEDDFYRYLWDGAIVSHYQNPYDLAPAEVAESSSETGKQLALDAGPIFERINYRQLRTVYPPVAQLGFALAHWIEPWSLTAWRGVLLLFDIITVGLLVLLLRRLKRSPLWAAVYWWNPLVIKELFNSVHMDVLLLPFVLAAVLAIMAGWHRRAAASLAIAVGVKIWPILLMPFVLRANASNLRRLVGIGLLFSAIVAILFSPLYSIAWDESSGFVAYARVWETNDFLFRLVAYGVSGVLSVLAISNVDSGIAARILVACALLGFTLWLNRNETRDAEDLCRRVTLVIAALFLLSPTQFPWYYVWLAPFLALCPSFALLALTAALPLYYLRFYFDARDQVALFDYGIVWLEYVPIMALLTAEWLRMRRRSRPDVDAAKTLGQSNMRSVSVGQARVQIT